MDRVLLLIGSPKPQNSSSESLALHLAGHLGEVDVVTHRAHRVVRSESFLQRFLDDLAQTDVLLVSFPLYVDCLPYVLTRVLEETAARYTPPAGQRLFAIANCGFPEPEQNDIALGIMQAFAEEVGFAWAGSVAVGMGVALNGQDLDALGPMARGVGEALAEAADSLVEGTPFEAHTAPIFPKWMYTTLGTLGWNRQARENGVREDIGARPYLD